MPMLAQTDAGAVESFLATLGRSLPRVLAFLLILVVGYLVAKVAARVVDRVLSRVGFDRAVERGGVGRVLARTRYDPSRLLGSVVFYGLLLFVLQAAFGVFGPNPVSDLIRGVLAYLPNVFVAVVLIVVAAALAAAVCEIVEAALGDLPSARPIAVTASVVVLVVGVFAALDQLNVAPDVVNILFIAVVAAVTGSIVVGVGGSLILPLRGYWERVFTRLEQEGPRLREQTAGAGSRIRARAEERAEQARDVQRRARHPEPQPEEQAPERPAAERGEPTRRSPERPAAETRRSPERPAAETRRSPERPQAETRRSPERPQAETRRSRERPPAETRRSPERPVPPPQPAPEPLDAPAEAGPHGFDLPRPRLDREDTRRPGRSPWDVEEEPDDRTRRLPPRADRPRPGGERPRERREAPPAEEDLTQPLRPVRPVRPEDEPPNGRRRSR